MSRRCRTGFGPWLTCIEQVITALLPKGHYQVEYLPDPAEDPIERDSSVWEDEGGVYRGDDLERLS